MKNIVKVLQKDLEDDKIYLIKPLTYFINLKDLESNKEIIFQNINSRLVFFGKGQDIDLNIISNFNIKDFKLNFDRTNGQLLTDA